MITGQAEGFMQLTWMVMLAIPAVTALLHIPLVAERLWRKVVR